jgi:hypothetical protein
MSIGVIVPKTQRFNLPIGENNAGNQFGSAIILIMKNTLFSPN